MGEEGGLRAAEREVAHARWILWEGAHHVHGRRLVLRRLARLGRRHGLVLRPLPRLALLLLLERVLVSWAEGRRAVEEGVPCAARLLALGRLHDALARSCVMAGRIECASPSPDV